MEQSARGIAAGGKAAGVRGGLGRVRGGEVLVRRDTFPARQAASEVVLSRTPSTTCAVTSFDSRAGFFAGLRGWLAITAPCLKLALGSFGFLGG